jgi:hypothetical protein
MERSPLFVLRVNRAKMPFSMTQFIKINSLVTFFYRQVCIACSQNKVIFTVKLLFGPQEHKILEHYFICILSLLLKRINS